MKVVRLFLDPYVSKQGSRDFRNVLGRKKLTIMSKEREMPILSHFRFGKGEECVRRGEGVKKRVCGVKVLNCFCSRGLRKILYSFTPFLFLV